MPELEEIKILPYQKGFLIDHACSIAKLVDAHDAVLNNVTIVFDRVVPHKIFEFLMKQSRNIKAIFFKGRYEDLSIEFKTYLLVEKVSQKLDFPEFNELSEQTLVVELSLSIW